jgi:2-phospho-L-lactate guanylyltransferase
LNGEVIPAAWTAIIPVKPLATAKSRLAHGSQFAEAFLLDVIAAVQGTALVTQIRIVTSDDDVRRLAGRHDCSVVLEATPCGINEAVALAGLDLPPSSGVVVLLGDLPCLTSEALAGALSHASAHDIAFVSDECGTGSTMWFSRSGAPVITHFGERSRAAHRVAGAVEIDVDPGSSLSSRLHRDVDTEVDLWDAVRIGVGMHTARLLAGGLESRARTESTST